MQSYIAYWLLGNVSSAATGCAGDPGRAQGMLLAGGITSVQDVIIGGRDHMRIYRNLAERYTVGP